jgi:hypothetical protein
MHVCMRTRIALVGCRPPSLPPPIAAPQADVLALGHSTPSYMAALHRSPDRGLTLYDPHWSPPLPGWMVWTGRGSVREALEMNEGLCEALRTSLEGTD